MRLPASFGSRLQASFAEFGHLCVGIDPHPALLASWGLSDSAESLFQFGKTVIDECQGHIGMIKPQVAFFERMGSKGFAALEKLAEYANERKLIVIMDAKRGDIGTTMNGYFDAWLGKSAPFLCDALTVSPYLGFDSLLQTLSAAHERGKGVFVLAATSNSEARELQTAKQHDSSVASAIWRKLGDVNRAVDGERMGSFGAVIGATVDPRTLEIELTSSNTTPILAPGFGVQGASLGQFNRLFGEASARTIATVSRSVLDSGPNALGERIQSSKNELKGNQGVYFDSE